MLKGVPKAYADWLKQYDDMWNWYAHFTFRLENTKHGQFTQRRLISYLSIG